MKLRTILTLLAVVCFGLSVRAVLHNQQRLNAARALENAPNDSPPATPPNTVTSSPAEMNAAVPSEMLRLRAEVTRLSARKRELEGGTGSSEARGPKAIGVGSAKMMPLPPGYIRKSKARFAGYSTPENAIESMLWAAHNQDMDAFIQCFTEETAAAFKGRFVSESDRKEFFKDFNLLPGMLVGEKEQLPDGRMNLKVEFVPGMPTRSIQLMLVDGQWKLGSL